MRKSITATGLLVFLLFLSGCSDRPHPISVAEAESVVLDIMAGWLYDNYLEDSDLSVQAKTEAYNEAVALVQGESYYRKMIQAWALLRESELEGKITPEEADGKRAAMLSEFDDRYADSILACFESRRGT